MEDFVREIGHGSSLFLLFGDTGVGKSRLLHELIATRLREHNCHTIDFAQSNMDDMAEAFENLASKAGQGDVIAVDHFESASNRAQDQIFKSWQTEGRDKDLNIIIVATSTSFNAFRQLAQQYQVEAKSFQLMPCSTAEVESYLQFRLFPDEASTGLVIPSALKKQIRQGNGVFARLNAIIEREGDSIHPGNAREHSSTNRPAIALGFLAIAIIISGLIFFHQPGLILSPDIVTDMDPGKVDKIILVPVEKQPGDLVEIPAEPEMPTIIEVEESVDLDSETDTPKTNQAELEIVETGQQENLAVTENLEVAVTEPEPDQEQEPEPVQTDWFQQLLDHNLGWIKQGDKQRGTIQIMTIGFDSFNQSAYQAYLDRLSASNIDTDQVRIFRTSAANQVVYSIIYGEYESRREAGQQIQSLPEAIGAASPIPRTTGSIVREIERLENP